jgi:hypothetical protein
MVGRDTQNDGAYVSAWIWGEPHYGFFVVALPKPINANLYILSNFYLNRIKALLIYL